MHIKRTLTLIAFTSLMFSYGACAETAYPYPLAHSLHRWVYDLESLEGSVARVEVHYYCMVPENAYKLAKNLGNEYAVVEKPPSSKPYNEGWLGYKGRVRIKQTLPESREDYKQWLVDQYYLGHEVHCDMDGYKPVE